MRIPRPPLGAGSPSTMAGANGNGCCVACNTTERVSIHYNAMSCHGCKAFFRRTIFERRDYSCSAEGRCEITDENRNQCRACRFQKCVRGGMNPKHVREERIKRALNGAAYEIVDSPSGFSVPVEEHPLTERLAALERLIGSPLRSERAELTRRVKEQFAIPDIDMNAHWNCERIMNEADVINSFYLGFLILSEWAGDIAEFRTLSQADQKGIILPPENVHTFNMLLFRQNFMVFGWLHYVYQSLPRNQERVGVPLGNGSYIPYKDEEINTMELKWRRTYGVLGKKLVEMVGIPLRELEVDFEEYCIMKTMSLFHIDNQLSEAGQQTATAFTDELLAALLAHIERRFPQMSHGQRSQRAMKLTLLFPSLMQIGHLEALYVQQMSKNIAESNAAMSSASYNTPPPQSSTAFAYTFPAPPTTTAGFTFTNCNSFLDTNQL